MKVLWSWLLELCDLDKVPSVEDGAKALTRGGLEIEALTDLGAGFSGVVVAQVVGKKPHPDSNKLTLVDVITEKRGSATQVVCGANNVPEPGGRVLWAQVGATLPNGMTLAPKPVKGIVSPGMLCSEDELGLGDDHSGIVVLDADDTTALGAPAQQALFLDDWLLEVNAPANRGDVLGHIGVARELCAMLRGKLVMPSVDLTDYAGAQQPKLEIGISNPEACARYVGRVVEGLKVGPSPKRLARRLQNVGVRSISNLVDVTNYVMFELGQPLHAFDLDKLTSGRIEVSFAKDTEKLKTLDGVDRTLVNKDLLIRDGDRGVALAGVMGGLDTEVTDGTSRVLLEAASFTPILVRRTARRLGLHSEASHRFERGVDAEIAPIAAARAARLLCMYGGGKVAEHAIDTYPRPRTAEAISVRLPRVRMVTGVALDVPACKDALDRLGFGVATTGEMMSVTPPSARADVSREVDVIEEILRIVGYDRVPSTIPTLRETLQVHTKDRADVVRIALAGAGLSEAITFAFQSVERHASLGIAATDRRAQPIAVRNPMGIDQAVMRTSLLPNLIAAIARNASYGRPDLALFEVGNIFLRRGEGVADRPLTELADEPVWAAGVLAGRRSAQLGKGEAWDVFDAKGFALAAIAAVCGDIPVIARATRSVSYLHPGVAGELLLERNGEPIGWFGEIHPKVRNKLGVEGAVFGFDLELTRLPLARPAQMRTIPKYPGSTRDVSLLLAAEIPAARIVELIAETAEPLVSQVRLLEDYRDAKLPEGTKSMLWSIAYRSPERTLTDVEVDKAHEHIVGRLVERLPAQRR